MNDVTFHVTRYTRQLLSTKLLLIHADTMYMDTCASVEELIVFFQRNEILFTKW